MISIVNEAPEHFGARELLLDRCFGEDRFAKTSERLREGRLPVFAFAALNEAGLLAGTVRLWSVADRNGTQSLLLGPLAVAPECRGRQVGDRLLRHALNQVAVHGHGSVILVGDQRYYTRFGFSAGLLNRITLPGPVAHDRFLGLEIVSGQLSLLSGEISAAGEKAASQFFSPALQSLLPDKCV
ncbi:MAG: N-acetyltransferase [Roseibium sp.]|uniref:GNAT family N-acetyltransferase n=1 Tax=Roseibium sp. TaxID=1936156 RepID=UPI00262DEDD5|nr:N-acetyltransferase [Roseibium sp.]MCV0424089.1 N-acetyltransferase [Roseibium sp.]